MSRLNNRKQRNTAPIGAGKCEKLNDMKYENFAQAQNICERIRANEKLLDNLKAAEEVCFQLPSGCRIETIQCGIRAETDYRLDVAAVGFKKEIIKIVQETIESLRSELIPL